MDLKEITPESAHADDLEITQEELASVLSDAEPENGIDVPDTPEMIHTKLPDDIEPTEDTTQQTDDSTLEDDAYDTDDDSTDESDVVDDEADTEVETHDNTAKKSEPRIPKSRFDEVNNKAKQAKAEVEALRRELEALKAGLQQGQQQEAPQQQEQQQPTFDFDAKEREYMDAVLDGEVDKALQIRNEIRKAELEAAQKIAANKSQESVADYNTRIQLEQTVSRINEQYPVFDPSADSFNEVALQEALQIRDGLIATGVNPVEAVQKAAELTSFKYTTPATKQDDGQVTKQKPTKQRVPKQKVDTANKQPPAIGDKTTTQADTGTKIDVMRMTDEEFDALSEDDIKKLLAS